MLDAVLFADDLLMSSDKFEQLNRIVSVAFLRQNSAKQRETVRKSGRKLIIRSTRQGGTRNDKLRQKNFSSRFRENCKLSTLHTRRKKTSTRGSSNELFFLIFVYRSR